LHKDCPSLSQLGVGGGDEGLVEVLAAEELQAGDGQLKVRANRFLVLLV
jgi:hypothetical protein